MVNPKNGDLGILYLCTMPNWLKKIAAYALTSLVLLSTLSWSIEKHMCMGRVMDIAFFHQAEDCGMEDAMALMGEASEENHCCNDESFTIEGQDDLNVSWDKMDLNVQQFLVAFSYSYLNSLSSALEDSVISATDPPPLLVRDLILLHEVYLI